jgi:hypothetical protein
VSQQRGRADHGNSQAGHRREAENIQAQIDALEAALVDKFPVETRIDWLIPGSAEFTSKNGAEAEFLPDGSFRVGGKNPDKDVYTIKFNTAARQITHLQVEAIPDENVGKGGPAGRSTATSC